MMKKIEAIVKHFKMEEVKNALEEARNWRNDGKRSQRLWISEGSSRNLCREWMESI